MASKWMFGCKKGLSQTGCQKYKRDPDSRGAANGIDGCPSCANREPYNEETAKAEAAAK